MAARCLFRGSLVSQKETAMKQQTNYQVGPDLKDAILSTAMRGKDFVTVGFLKSQAYDEVEVQEAVKFADAQGLKVMEAGRPIKVH